jgi:hypothetical protein
MKTYKPMGEQVKSGYGFSSYDLSFLSRPIITKLCVIDEHVCIGWPITCSSCLKDMALLKPVKMPD